MALFFAMMHCDPHTWGEQYVCRDNACVGVKKSVPFLDHKRVVGRKWPTLGACQQSCGKSMVSALPSPGLRGATSPLPSSELKVSPHSLPASASDLAPAPEPFQLPFEQLQVAWRSCVGFNAIVPIDDFGPSTIPVHGTTKFVGTGILPKDIQGGNFTIKLENGALGITLIDVWGDFCSSKSVSTLFGLIRFTWDGFDCPVKAGKQSVPLSLTLAPVIPLFAAQTTTTVMAMSAQGEQLFCIEVVTTGKGQGQGPVFPTPVPTPSSIVWKAGNGSKVVV